MEDIKFDKNKLIDTVKNSDELPMVKDFFNNSVITESIESGKFTYVYDLARATGIPLNLVTATLLLSDINPLESINQIPYGMFERLPIEEIHIPSNINFIRTAAFKDCSSLKKVYLEQTLLGLTPYAFDRCDNLKVINFNGAAWKWESLTSTIPFSSRTTTISRIECLDDTIKI